MYDSLIALAALAHQREMRRTAERPDRTALRDLRRSRIPRRPRPRVH
jgi:hypothetical protein